MTDQAAKYTDEELEKLEKKIKQIYSEAQKDIQKKLKEYESKFVTKNEIYLKQVDEGKITWDQYSAWLDGQIFQGEQWEAKRDQIIKIIQDANKQASNILNGKTIDVFAENANWSHYEMENGEGVNFGFGLYDAHAVTNLIKEDPQILPKWKVNEKKDYTWNKKKVNNAITQGIIQGERLDQITQRLVTSLKANNVNTMLTFARTAMTGAQNAGRYQGLMDAKDLGIDVVKVWMATLDDHTRVSHQEIDGEEQKVGDKWHPFKFSNGCRYPGDPLGPPHEVYNCRCTLVSDIKDYPSKFKRYDNIEGKPIDVMTYKEWKEAKKEPETIVDTFQSMLGRAKTVEEINDLINDQGWFRTKTEYHNHRYDADQGRWVYDTVEKQSQADLTGCDIDSARSVAASYEQIFEKYPGLIGRFDAPDAQPVGMGDNTYAWCYIRGGGKVEVNPKRYSNWNWLVSSYERDVASGWHPQGTTAESIVIHEIGHAIDGLLADRGVLGGYTSSGQFRYASSSLKSTIMNRAAKLDPEIAEAMELDRWLDDNSAVQHFVSRYATKNSKEWFAECFAEYITSANPRTVASEFGKELEKLVAKLE